MISNDFSCTIMLYCKTETRLAQQDYSVHIAKDLHLQCRRTFIVSSDLENG